jgi:hypothetical protein
MSHVQGYTVANIEKVIKLINTCVIPFPLKPYTTLHRPQETDAIQQNNRKCGHG